MFIISNFPPYVGGAERQAFILAQALGQQGTMIEVLTRYWAHLPHEEMLNGVLVHRSGLSMNSKLGSTLSAVCWMYHILRRGRQIQLFHAHQPYSALWIALLGKLLWGGRVVVKIPGPNAVYCLKSSWAKREVAKRFVDAITVVSSANHDDLLELGFPSSKIWTIPNGVDLAIPHERFSSPFRDGRHSVVFVGRLIATKRVDILLESWKAIEKTTIPAPQMYIVGDGSERDRLEQYACSLGLTSVHFMGMVKNCQPFLQHATVWVSPSTREGLSNSLLEAMAEGLPIVATRISSMREVIRSGETGLLVEPGSASALSDALSQLLQDPDLREQLGQKARQTVEQSYGISGVARKYSSLYLRLTSCDR